MKTHNAHQVAGKSTHGSRLRQQVLGGVSGPYQPMPKTVPRYKGPPGAINARRHSMQRSRNGSNHVTQSQQALVMRLRAGRRMKSLQTTLNHENSMARNETVAIEHQLLGGGRDGVNLVLTTGRDDDASYLIMSLEVPAPLTEAYDIWNAFPDLPYFMKGTQTFGHFDGGCMTWRVHTPSGQFVWRASVCELEPCALIAWRSPRGMPHANFGSVSFEPVDSRQTCVFIQIGFASSEDADGSGDPVPSLIHALERTLRRFHGTIESRAKSALITRSINLTETCE